MKQSMKKTGGVLGLVLGSVLAGTLCASDTPPSPVPLGDHPAATQPSTDNDHPWQDRLAERRKMRDGNGPGGAFAGTLTPQQVDDALAILREIRPDREQELETIRKTNPEKVVEILREAMPRLIELGFLHRHDPDLYKLRIEDYRLERNSQELARQVRQADAAKDDAKSKLLRAQLESKIEEHFNLRQKIREHELAQLEKQINEMHTKIEATKKAKDRLIKERMDELIGEPSRPEW